MRVGVGGVGGAGADVGQEESTSCSIILKWGDYEVVYFGMFEFEVQGCMIICRYTIQMISIKKNPA
jgi:hypothetical protein